MFSFVPARCPKSGALWRSDAGKGTPKGANAKGFAATFCPFRSISHPFATYLWGKKVPISQFSSRSLSFLREKTYFCERIYYFYPR